MSRRDFRTALVGGIIGALVVGVLTPVGAAIGDVMKVGKVNTANATTTMQGWSAATLKLVQNNPAGKPFMLGGVGRGNKVRYLNADRLDGRHAGYFLPKNGKAADSDRVDGFHANTLVRVAHDETGEFNEGWFLPGADGGDMLSTQISAPTAGLLFIVAGVDSDIGASRDLYYCYLRVDQTDVLGSIRWVEVSNVNTSSVMEMGSENCATNGVKEVAAGGHTVELRIGQWGGPSEGSANFHDASLQVLFVPFGADGTQPIYTGGW